MQKNSLSVSLIALALFIMLLPTPGYSQSWLPATQVTSGNFTNAISTYYLDGILGRMFTVNGNPAVIYGEGVYKDIYYVRATDASGTTWGVPVKIVADYNSTQELSVAIINGNPAVAYRKTLTTAGQYYICYLRATDVNGTTWGSQINVTTAGSSSSTQISLKTVNGNPAIAYYEASAQDLKYVRATDASGTTWGTPVTIQSTGDVGQYVSMEIVNGNPAIAYQDVTNTDLKYIRATDVSGTAWGTAVTLDGAGSNGNSLVIVNGNPAVAYYEPTALDLKYVRATDASGTTWSSATSIDGTGNVGKYPSMEIVNGNPAIAYYDVTNTSIKYIRASDASGSAWSASQTVENPTDVGQYASLAVINGNPAISYFYNTGASNYGLRYIRATDASGTAWGTPVLTYSPYYGGADYTTSALVNGNPAVAYYEDGTGDLRYVRAGNDLGTAWGTNVLVTSTNDVGQKPSLAVVNGNPAISYYDLTNTDLYYVRASNSTGSSWGTPVGVATGSANIGQISKLLIVSGNPAIVYTDGSALKYIRATDADGTTWGTAVTISASVEIVNVGFAIVNSNPAISYTTGSGNFYIRATNTTGSAWGTAVNLGSTSSFPSGTSLAVINGNPAVAAGDISGMVPPGFCSGFYIRASDASGSTWGTAVTFSSQYLGYPQLTTYNGNPIIIYNNRDISDGTYVSYIVASNVNGTAWGSSAALTLPCTGSTYNYPTTFSNNGNLFVVYQNETQKLPYIKWASTNKVWTGGAGTTTWTTTSNWADNAAPTASNDVLIPSGFSFYPDITSGTASCKGLSIYSGASLSISGGTLEAAGDIINNGTFNGTGGTLTLNGSTAQSITAGTLNITNLTLNNSAGATISSGAVNVLGTYTPTSGTLTTGGFLTLKSTASGTARIAAGSSGGGYISGNVNTERYIPGRRAFRFLSHPFTSAQSMSALTDDIDITGSGGSPFTATGTGNPSAFYFDVTTADNTTTGNNPGWTPFTASSTWAQYQAMRVLIRGAKGEGLVSGSYTPSNTTLDMSGAINQGDVNMSLTKGSSSNFVLVGNPFPSQVNMDALSLTNVGSSFYIWDATQGAKGGYTSYNFGSSSFNLPSGGAFSTTLSASGSIVFEEADKTSSTAGTMFKTTAPKNMVQLRLEDSTIFWDRLLLKFDDNAMATVDYPDAPKLYNPDMSFYTWSKDDSMLSIDARPYAEETIKLGLYSTQQKNFRIIAADFDMPLGTKLFLKDKYLNITQEITGAGYEYWFATSADPASWGNNRFELNTQGKPTGVLSSNVTNNILKIKLVPNPASDKLMVYTEGADGSTTITITNMMGVKVAEQETTGNIITMSLKGIANGVYTVTVHNAGKTITQKLIKQ